MFTLTRNVSTVQINVFNAITTTFFNFFTSIINCIRNMSPNNLNNLFNFVTFCYEENDFGNNKRNLVV